MNKPREPLMMFGEIADTFGVHYMELVRLMKKHAPHPLPKITHDGNVASSKKTYYSLREMRVWWQSIAK